MSSKMRGREKFNKYKKIILFISKTISVLPKRTRNRIFDSLRTIKGTKGIVMRYILLKSLAIYCGDNVSIHSDVYLFNPEKIAIGDNVSVHPMCYIDATGGVEIGNDVSIAHGTSILSTTHRYDDKSTPIKDQGFESSRTTISNNVWIGSKVTILSGVTINSGSVVAANAVVAKNIEKDTIVGGIPAKLIKNK